jgi:TonB-linked SusC/RagA family outer membrane protein
MVVSTAIAWSATTYSQSTKLSVNLKDVTVRDAIKTIEEKNDFLFLFQKGQVDLNRRISIRAEGKQLQEILDEIFKGTDNTYIVSDHQVVIGKAPRKVQEAQLAALQKDLKTVIEQQPRRQRNIIGKVTDTSGEPLPGATVMVKGTTIGTITDANGNFSLRIPRDAQTLQVSFIGMKTQEVSIDNRTTFNVMLEEEAIGLEEVVAIGYGVSRKSDLTGAVTSAKIDEVEMSRSMSFLDALQGKVAGVQIGAQSGEPGVASNIIIRGANSINAGIQPLYVIDGVQIEMNNNEIVKGAGSVSTLTPLASLSPNDIESIEILKDASATAIYGAKAANGVIIVTTKSGKAGLPKFDFTASYGILKVPQSKLLDVLTPQEYIDYRYQKEPTGLLYGVDLDGDGKADEPAPLDDPRFTVNEFKDKLLRQGNNQTYNLSYMGGSGKTSFTSSLGYTGQDAVIVNNKFERFSGKIKIDQDFSSKMQVGTSLNFGHMIRSGVATDAGEGSYYGFWQRFYITPPVVSRNDQTLSEIGSARVESLVLDSYRKITFSNLIGKFYFDYSLLKSLRLRNETSVNLTWSDGREFYPSNTPIGLYTNGQGIAQNIHTTYWNNSTTLNYLKKIGKHRINGLLGFEVSRKDYDNLNSTVQQFTDESTGVYDLTKGNLYLPPVTGKWQKNNLSYFGRVNYNFGDRYLITMSLRADGSSIFGEGNKFGYFPSAAFAWRVSEEKFLKNSPFISNLKLRLSTGTTGNDRIAAYSSLPKMNSSFYPSNDVMYLGMFPSSSGNKNLKWETTIQYNAGIDLGLFNNRVNFVVDVFHKTTKDMLLNADLPSHTGFSRQFKNIGNVDNNGIELTLSTINIHSKNFEWTTDFNFNSYKNKVTNLGNEDYMDFTIGGSHMSNVGRIIKGEPLGTMYGYVFDGIYQTADFDVNGKLIEGVPSIAGYTAKAGDFKFKDISGPEGKPDGIVDAQYDRTVIGNSNPDFFGGMTNSFRIKNFDFSFLIEFSVGKDIYNLFKYYVEGRANFNITEKYFYNHWTPDNPTNKYGSFDNGLKLYVSSYYVEDGSYAKLKSMTFGYNFPKKLTQNLKINNLKVYLTATNLLTLTHYSGSDPDVNFNNQLLPGLDRCSFPFSQTFMGGINISF